MKTIPVSAAGNVRVLGGLPNSKLSGAPYPTPNPRPALEIPAPTKNLSHTPKPALILGSSHTREGFEVHRTFEMCGGGSARWRSDFSRSQKKLKSASASEASFFNLPSGSETEGSGSFGMLPRVEPAKRAWS